MVTNLIDIFGLKKSKGEIEGELNNGDKSEIS
jgi:hypothetical protein